MSCIDPTNEFDETNYTPPKYCNNSGVRSVLNNPTTCSVWDGAVGAVQCAVNSTLHDARCQKLGQNIKDANSGNWQATLSQCQRIQSNQIKTTGNGNVFDIEQLQNNWVGGEYSGIACARSLYGAFQANGCRSGEGGLPCETTNETHTVSKYWNSIRENCEEILGTIDGNDNVGVNTPGSYTRAFKDFSAQVDKDGSSSIVNLAFDCVPPSSSMYTQCKVPGWDMIATDTNKKGWMAITDNCGKNPLYDSVQDPVINKTYTCNNPPPNEQQGNCNDGYVPCQSPVDLRPVDPRNGNCCLSCDHWNKPDGYQTYFSYQDATSSTNIDKTTTTYKDLLKDACSKGCCIKKNTTSDSTADQICADCQTANSQSGNYDMSNSTVTFFPNPNSGNHSPRTIRYVNSKDSDGKTKKGIAITPTGGNSVAPSMFSDVRECNYNGTAQGLCTGVTGCFGFVGTSDASNPYAYCINNRLDCVTDNACNHGFSYIGDDTEASNPATNCPNTYTLSRIMDPDCPTCMDYDYSQDSTFYLTDLDKITIPEGAWVTGYFNSNVIGSTWNKPLCKPNSDQDNMVMMGCAQDGSKGLKAYASTFISDSNGNFIVNKGNTTVKVGNGQTLYLSDHIKAVVVDKDGNSIKDSKAQPFACQFTGLSNTEVPYDPAPYNPPPLYEQTHSQSTTEKKPRVNDDNQKTQTTANAYIGYTFGFMPGYYNPKYSTSSGICTDNDTRTACQ